MTAHMRLARPLVSSIRKALTQNALPGETHGLTSTTEQAAAEFLTAVGAQRRSGAAGAVRRHQAVDRAEVCRQSDLGALIEWISIRLAAEDGDRGATVQPDAAGVRGDRENAAGRRHRRRLVAGRQRSQTEGHGAGGLGGSSGAHR